MGKKSGKVEGHVDAVSAAQAFASKFAVTVAQADKPARENPFARVGCFFGGCDERFLPHSIGRFVHSRCAASRTWTKSTYRPLLESVGDDAEAARVAVFETAGLPLA